MDDPSTTLDHRFSEAHAVPTAWDVTQRSLELVELFWFATVRANGRPYLTPLVTAWLDGSIHFCTGVDEQKAANSRANDQVSLTTGNNRSDGGLDVVVEGVVLQ